MFNILHSKLRAGEDPSEFVSKIGSRIVHVHFRDYPHRGQIPTDVASTYIAGFEQYEPWVPPVEQQIPGRGGIDFPKILRALKNAGYDKAVDIVMVGALPLRIRCQGKWA